MQKSEGGGGGGTNPESSKVVLLAKVWEKSSALKTNVIAELPSEWNTGGYEEEVKLLEMFFGQMPEIYLYKSFWQVIEQTRYDFGQRAHKIKVMESLSTFCKQSLYHV